jgi:hypothetical protein
VSPGPGAKAKPSVEVWTGVLGVRPGVSLTSAAQLVGGSVRTTCGSSQPLRFVAWGRRYAVAFSDNRERPYGRVNSIYVLDRRLTGPHRVKIAMSERALRAALGPRAVRLGRGAQPRVDLRTSPTYFLVGPGGVALFVATDTEPRKKEPVVYAWGLAPSLGQAKKVLRGQSGC